MNNTTSKKFLLSSLGTTLVLFILNAIVFEAFLKNFFLNHPAVSPEFMKQLYRPDDQMIWWAVVLSAIAIGVFVTTAVYWSGARTFTSGLRSGFIFGILLLCSVDFGLYASTNNFTLSGAFADMLCSTTTVSLSGAVSAVLLALKKKAS